MKHFICKHFGHKWTYYVTGNTPQGHIRHCSRCNRGQELKEIHFIGKSEIGWVYLVQRTKVGAKNFVEKLKTDF
jgi:hypothetical protein